MYFFQTQVHGYMGGITVKEWSVRHSQGLLHEMAGYSFYNTYLGEGHLDMSSFIIDFIYKNAYFHLDLMLGGGFY